MNYQSPVYNVNDELLRLKQISGLAALFKDREFSSAWVKDESEADFYQVAANG